jgi:predicted transcriptional regulator
LFDFRLVCGSRNIDRSNIEVISQILKVANGGNATKTRIRYKAFLGYNQLKEHLVLLTEWTYFATTEIQEHLTLLKRVYSFFKSTMR